MAKSLIDKQAFILLAVFCCNGLLNQWPIWINIQQISSAKLISSKSSAWEEWYRLMPMKLLN